MLAEACGNRTHPGRLSETRNGFEARENHQAPCASAKCDGSKGTKLSARGSYFLLSIFHFPFVIFHWGHRRLPVLNSGRKMTNKKWKMTNGK